MPKWCTPHVSKSKFRSMISGWDVSPLAFFSLMKHYGTYTPQTRTGRTSGYQLPVPQILRGMLQARATHGSYMRTQDCSRSMYKTVPVPFIQGSFGSAAAAHGATSDAFWHSLQFRHCIQGQAHSSFEFVLLCEGTGRGEPRQRTT